MADYLKDINLKFLTIKSDELESLQKDMEKIFKEAKSIDNSLQLHYILRYDGIGIIRTDFDEIKSCFEKAKTVERLVLKIGSNLPDYINHKSIEIKLDKDIPDNSILVVYDNDESWVDNKFKHLKSRLDSYKNKNQFAHSSFFELFIQIVGILTGLLIALIGSTLLAPKMAINNSFFVLFFGFFLIFSNLWTYILFNIRRLRNKLWNFVSFKKKPIGLIGQTIISTIIGLILAGLVKFSWTLLTELGTKIIEK